MQRCPKNVRPIPQMDSLDSFQFQATQGKFFSGPLSEQLAIGTNQTTPTCDKNMKHLY